MHSCCSRTGTRMSPPRVSGGHHLDRYTCTLCTRYLLYIIIFPCCNILYVIVISRARGMYGIYCTKAKGHLRPRAEGNEYHAMHPKQWTNQVVCTITVARVVMDVYSCLRPLILHCGYCNMTYIAPSNNVATG